MKRGDAELASAMRKLLAKADTVIASHYGANSQYELYIAAEGFVTEEEMQAVEEAMSE